MPDPTQKVYKKKVQSFKTIEKASSLLKDALDHLDIREFPAIIKGKLVYSQQHENRPLVNARVFLQFQRDSATVNGSTVFPDESGSFSLATPDAARLSDKMTLEVKRGHVTERFMFSRGEAIKLGGQLGALTVSDDFITTEGMIEQVGFIVDSIRDVVADYQAPADDAVSNPPRVTLGEGNDIFSLKWDNSSSYTYSYKILHRLVEPDVSPAAVLSNDASKNKQRSDIGCPIDVAGFKKKLIESPRNQPKASSLGMGYVLLMNQEWKPSHFSLGTLLYSLALAPGEEQRIAVSERAESLAATDQEASSQFQSSRYSSAQSDSTSAIFQAALRESANGTAKMKGSNFGASTGSGSSAAGGGSYGTFSILGGAAALFGIGGSTTSSSSNWSQNRSQDYTTSAAQNFQENIQRAAESQSQANRVGVRLATATESEAVTTKIIANQNHSHALTMQFWEVVQNYRISSKISGVQLVLYIPLDIIPFLPAGLPHLMAPDELYNMTQQSEGKKSFLRRYDMLLTHYDSIAPYMPYQFRQGLDILRKFSSYPQWEFQGGDTEGGFTVQLKLTGSFMPYDNLTAAILLKRGGRLTAKIDHTPHEIPKGFHSSSELLDSIRSSRLDSSMTGTATFNIPPGVVDDDFAGLELYYSSSPYTYTLEPTLPDFFRGFADSSLEKLFGLLQITHNYGLINQEAFTNPIVRLSQSQLRSLGPLLITSVELGRDAQTQYLNSQRDEALTSRSYYPVYDRVRTMTFDQLQQIERTFQHVVENTMFYSQTVWASLTADERAMMLEQYTIGIPGETGDIGEEVPLMNCVQNEVYGFYGNCMLMPFGYPPSLAEKLHTSTREVQDALYNYHTMAFREPYTMISLPTRGMVGEAVLGASNSSEKIDLTRFWNWQDSPITHADSIKPSDFSMQHIITDKTTAPDELAKTANTVNVNTGGVAVPDLISTIAKTPAPAAIVGLDDLEKFASTLTTSGSAERQTVINNASQMTQQAIAGYVNMKAGVGMNGEKKAEPKADTKTETKTEQKTDTNKQATTPPTTPTK